MANHAIALDHIIILVPYATLQTPSTWLTENFTISPGGRHADNRTENRLVIFQDGSYLELIAFINDDPALRAGHWWDKPFGIVDFAFTTSDGAMVNFADVHKRLEAAGSEVRYETPRKGSRKKDDGTEIAWEVTFPVVGDHYQRGELPFFCHDTTERNLRAPIDESHTTHPGFGYGIKGLVVYVPEEKVDAMAKAYAAILDRPNMAEVENLGIFQLERLFPVEGATRYVDFTIQPPQEDWQIEAVEKRGMLLGDMIIGGISMLASPGLMFRIDIDDDVADGNEGGGIGRVFRGLDLPPGWSVPGDDSVEQPERTPGTGDLEPVPEIGPDDQLAVDPRTGRLSHVQRDDKSPSGKEVK